jgi:hypothetical protein
MWSKRFGLIRKMIEVDFDNGVGSHKSGTIQCSYDIKNNETPVECLRRMERQRKFR